MTQWAAFVLLIAILLAMDLGVFHQRARAIGAGEAITWSLFWVFPALGFNVWLWRSRGSTTGTEFLAAYLTEKSLSVDNIFAFLALFAYFKLPAEYHYRVLFWGVLGALLIRGLMISAGIALLQRFDWVVYILGGFLFVAGIRMALETTSPRKPAESGIMQLAQRLVPITEKCYGHRFFVHQNGRLKGTPLLLALVTIEVADAIFSLDSVPAVFAVTRDPYVAWTSNVFALLGIRALYFAFAGLSDRFVYLKYGVAAVLMFLGVKIFVSGTYPVSPAVSLTIIAILLGGSLIPSIPPIQYQCKLKSIGLPRRFHAPS